MRKPDYNRRVVVTGLGVVSPVGNDMTTAWTNLLNGVSGLGEITRFDASGYDQHAAGEVHDFDPTDWMDAKAARRSESDIHFGVAAAKQALADSGFEITDENRTDVGVIFGSGAGGQRLMIDNYRILHEKGPSRVAPTFIANALVDSASGMIAIETGAIGHNMCIVSACATGTHNVGEAAEVIRRGDCIAVISGSTETPLLEVAHAGFGNMRGMGSPRPGEALDDSIAPVRPTRDGFVLGEGAGRLFLEDLELAKARGAQIYAEVVGYGSAADGWDMIQPIETGVGSARAMKMALERRGVPADEVDLINPHGTSTPLGDKREAEAHLGRLRRSRPPRAPTLAGHQRHEVDDRPHDGRRRGLRGLRDGHVRRRADASPGTINYRDAGPGVRPLGRRRDDRGARSATPCRTTSASAATTARSSSSATTATERASGEPGRRRYDPRTIEHCPTEVPSVPEPTPPAVPSSPASARSCRSATTSDDLLGEPARRRDRHAADHAASTRPRSRSGSRPRSWTSIRPTVMDRQDGPPDEPVHPPRDGRRQRGRRGIRASTSRRWTPEQRDRVGVVVNTGGGGIEHDHRRDHVHDRRVRGSSARSRCRPLSGSDGRRSWCR